MLRKVYSSKDKEIVLDLMIEVMLTDANLEYLAASSIKPVRLEDKQIDPVAFQEYEDFVENVLNLLVTYNMHVMELKPSPKSETSWYTWFYPTDSNGSVKSKVIFKLRISDHFNHWIPKQGKSQKDADRLMKQSEARYNQETANRYKLPETKPGNQRFKVLNVVVNNETFESYDEALDYVDQLLSRL